MNAYILALDQGTTSSRAILFDRHGEPVTVTQKEFRQHYPRPGWVEHDPEEIWETQLATALEALEKAGINASELAGIGIANQRETTILWDRATGRPIHRAIVWQDRRTAPRCAELEKQGLGPLISEKTGLRLDPYFSATKAEWLLDHVDGARRKAEAGEILFGTVDTWLLWKLSGRHLTDVTNASRTLLWNISDGTWDSELLGHFRIPPAMLPEVVPSSGIAARTRNCGLPDGVPIAGIAGDQQAALFGQACFAPGMAKNTYGTGCFVLLHTGREIVSSKNHLVTTVAWKLGEEPMEYALEGSVFVAGALFQWLRDELQLFKTAQEIDALAESVEDSGGVVLVPAFAGLGAPHWDPHARGALFGVTRGTSRAHIARAAIEAVAFQSQEVLECMEKDSGVKLRELRVDGGATASEPLLRFQAELLGVPVIRPAITETTALGAAYLAGLATGVWKSREEIARLWKTGATFTGGGKTSAQHRQRWDRAVERTKGWDL
jgi:glycerol kinase